MNVDAQAVIKKMTSNYAMEIAYKDQQIALLQVQIEYLTEDNAELKKKGK